MAGFLQNLAVISSVLFGGTVEASETYFCTFVPLTKTAWVPPRVAMRLADNRKSAQVWISGEGHPIAAVMEQRSDNSFLLDWTANRNSMIQTADFGNDRYRVILNVENMKVSLQVLSEAASVPQSSRGAGTCVLEGKIMN